MAERPPLTRVVADRYELLELIGGGGTALVYRARDRHGSGEVAVKLLRPDFAGQRVLRERFLREGELVRPLDDPTIVRVLQVGQEADVPFLVMELATGPTLRRALETAGPMSVAAASTILVSLTQALDRAHAAGIVHRDVKPENIFVDGSKVKLGDFGNARVVSLASVTGASLTWGTPEYVAPELFARGRADPRSDFYALGVVLYEMLTGRRPWSRGEALSRIAGLGAGARPLSPTGAGERVDRLLADLLAPAPGDRPASGREIRARLTGEDEGQTMLRIRCLSCGAPRAEDVPVCFACGQEVMRLPADLHGSWRVVLNRLDDDLASIDKLLRVIAPLAEPSDQPLLFLTGRRRLYSDDELKRGIDFPAVLFCDLSEEAARSIARLFRDQGFDASAVEMRVHRSLHRQQKRDTTFHVVGAATSVGWAVQSFSHNLAAGLGAAAAVAAWAIGLHSRARRALAEGSPGIFQLRRQLAPVPAADKVLSEVRAGLATIHGPEVRALLADVSTEIYRLSRRSTDLQVRSATVLLDRLVAMAKHLDALDDALGGGSEGELMAALARAERAAAAPTAGAHGVDWDATRRDLEATLRRRHAAEQDRARLAAKLCELLGRLRATARAAGRLGSETTGSEEVVENATAEVEVLLSAVSPTPRSASDRVVHERS